MRVSCASVRAKLNTTLKYLYAENENPTNPPYVMISGAVFSGQDNWTDFKPNDSKYTYNNY